MGFEDDDRDDFADDAGERDDLADVPGGVRLQKVLAAAGVGSRRHCEELIGAGRVEVEGQTVRRLGARVDPEHQVIRVDGKRIPSVPDSVYLAFNKPGKVLTAMTDDQRAQDDHRLPRRPGRADVPRGPVSWTTTPRD